MQYRYPLALLWLIFFGFSSCQREDSDSDELIDIIVSQPETYHDGNVFVYVRDRQNFSLSNSTIHIHDTEILTYINGVGILNDVPCGAHGSVFGIRKNGYAPAYSYAFIPKGDISNVSITLNALRSDFQFDSEQPYVYELSQNVKLHVKADAFGYEDGTPYTGQINVHQEILNTSLGGVPIIAGSGTKMVFENASIIELYFHDQQGRRLFVNGDLEIENPAGVTVASLNQKANRWLQMEDGDNILPDYFFNAPFAIGSAVPATFVNGQLSYGSLFNFQISSGLTTNSFDVPLSQNGNFGFYFPKDEYLALWSDEGCSAMTPVFEGSSGSAITSTLGSIDLDMKDYALITSQVMTCFEPLSNEDFIYTIISTPLDTMLFYQTENSDEFVVNSCHTDLTARVYQGGQFAYSIETSLSHQNTLRSSNICLSSAKNFLQINGSRQQYDTTEFFILLENDTELSITDLNNFVITFDKVDTPTRVQAHTILFNAPFDIACFDTICNDLWVDVMQIGTVNETIKLRLEGTVGANEFKGYFENRLR